MAGLDRIRGGFRRVYDRIRGRYALKIGLAILVVTVLLVGVGFFTFTSVQTDIESNAEQRLADSAEREAAGIDLFIKQRGGDALRLSSVQSLSTWSDERRQRELDTELIRLPETVKSIHYVNLENTEVIASTDPDWDGIEFERGEYPWAVDPVTLTPGDALLFQPYEVDRDKEIGFTSLALSDQSKAIVAVVDLQERSQLLDSPIEGGSIQLVTHEDGSVVLSQNLDDISQRHFLADDLEFISRSNTETRIDRVSTDTDQVNGSEMIVASGPVENARWSVVAAGPTNTIFATAQNVSRDLLLLIAIAVVGLVAVGAAITCDINNSLDRMTTYATEIEDGNLAIDIERSRTDEFGGPRSGICSHSGYTRRTTR
jgi:methyl-accepting chemotaxis protein